jgi:hypothetical protein
MSTWLVIVLSILAFNAAVLVLAMLLLALDRVGELVVRVGKAANGAKRRRAGASESPANATKTAH